MGDTLTLPVPETLYATYAVALARPVPDPAALAHEQVTRRVDPPLRDLVLGMLDSPMLTLDQRPAGDFPPLPAPYHAAPGDLGAIGAASHLLAVRAAYRPGWPPAHEWSARAVAGAVAASAAAPVVDVFTPRILSQEALQRSLPGPDGTIRLVDWMLLPHTSGPGGFWFSTLGLARFGLPEVEADNVPARLVEPWGRLLNGLARNVLDLWVDQLRTGEHPAAVDLPDTVSVGLRDIAAAQGGREPMHREVPVRLRLDPAALTVVDAAEPLCAALFGP
ncbi:MULTISPECIES: hypothetical protein [Actinomadura]|uniref:Uncharacterized protein n=1 Tax=Actinomadura litoris TaxID=2678616 RepID=A0A7K1L8X7_9ACTN|nr:MULTISPECIES: hypothetical protein [Actinomadura]MBT2213004.1 hypothetical protein [Actinomadura sp. NEAU-AAG7]MUN40763.1 hypothetical protein [Actinomadura litoris]